MEQALSGKVAIVTGAASAIGRASALALARAGAAVLATDLGGADAQRIAGEIEAAGGRAASIACDVSREDDVRAMVDAALDAFGGVDILHNNAAASSFEQMSCDRDILSMEIETWDRAFAVNLRGPMLGCKHAIPHMIARGGGAIVNTSSASGLAGDLARPAYGTTKGALNTLTMYVATLYGQQGIRCNAIAPGAMETPALIANLTAAQIAVYKGSNLVPRLGLPEDVAAAVVFLASPAAAFITGQVISVDGGVLAHHPSYAAVLAGAAG